ncbi:kinase-like protein [Mycena sp. CBHHK59/15]|nr:kinase-like protein [Mycena sp. CBHHK59/15]
MCRKAAHDRIFPSPLTYRSLLLRIELALDSSSYWVMHKLGFGSYATVWLAEKTDAPRAFVALKIATADGLSTKEAECLRMVQRQPSSHILTLADVFEMQGPNGVHTVLVTDVAAPVLSLLSSPRTVSWCKKVAYDLANAVAQLHASGIVHGDLYLGNVGIAMPQHAEQDPEDVMQDLDSYELTVVLPTDPKSLLPSLPAYLVVPCDMAAYYDRIAEMDDPQAKIFDFGSGRAVPSKPQRKCALEACAPETAFARTVGKVENPTMEPPADVWALGTMIYEIMYGSPLFRGLGMSALPAHMTHWSSTSLCDAAAWWNEHREQLRKACADDEDAEALVGLLREVLVLDPLKRPSATEVCRDAWFRSIAA